MCESLKGLLGLGLEGFGPGHFYDIDIDHLGYATSTRSGMDIP